MGEYGAVVGQNTSVGAGAASRGSSDAFGNAMDALSGFVEGLASLPVEVMVVIAAVVIVGGFMLSFRTS